MTSVDLEFAHLVPARTVDLPADDGRRSDQRRPHRIQPGGEVFAVHMRRGTVVGERFDQGERVGLLDRSVPLDRPFGGAKVIDLHQRHDLAVVTNSSIGVLIAQRSRCGPSSAGFSYFALR